MRAVIVLMLIAFIFFVKPVYALSCAPVKLTPEAIENTAIIFEGTMEKINNPSLFHILTKKESREKLYTFSVTRHWYGADEDKETIHILAAPGWAQQAAYEKGESYMVFGHSAENADYYKASPGWCGHDIYSVIENRKILQDYNSNKN